jgi:cytochrome c oxidase subunit 2
MRVTRATKVAPKLGRNLHHNLLPIAWLAAPLSASAGYSFNFPEPVTPIARETLHIHNEFMLVITVLFVVVFAIMIYSMIKHRKSSGHAPAKFTGPTSALQWFWALIPFAILLFIDFILMGIPAVQAIINMEDTKTRADMVLKVTGMQWKWQYEYPEAGVKFISVLTTPREQIANNEPKGENYLLEVDKPVVLPVGKKIRVLLTSIDVIHTWWVPQFGVKRDAVPGFLRETWLLIEKPGIYRGQCAELCGKDHGFMPVVVHAVPEPNISPGWRRKRPKPRQPPGCDRTWSKDELMAAGKDAYDKICAACHQPERPGFAAGLPGAGGQQDRQRPAA